MYAEKLNRERKLPFTSHSAILVCVKTVGEGMEHICFALRDSCRFLEGIKKSNLSAAAHILSQL
jgi:hypothetical protein